MLDSLRELGTIVSPGTGVTIVPLPTLMWGPGGSILWELAIHKWGRLFSSSLVSVLGASCLN